MKNANKLLDQPDNKEIRKPISHLMNAQKWRHEFQTEGSAEYPTQQCCTGETGLEGFHWNLDDSGQREVLERKQGTWPSAVFNLAQESTRKDRQWKTPTTFQSQTACNLKFCRCGQLLNCKEQHKDILQLQKGWAPRKTLKRQVIWCAFHHIHRDFSALK